MQPDLTTTKQSQLPTIRSTTNPRFISTQLLGVTTIEGWRQSLADFRRNFLVRRRCCRDSFETMLCEIELHLCRSEPLPSCLV